MIDVTVKPFVSAILVCAGSSVRMGGVDKMFIPIGGKNAIIWSALAFERSEVIDEIVIVTKNENIEPVNKLISAYHIRKVSCVISGGDTRQQSVQKGIAECWTNTEYYAIHDGARPLITAELIDTVIRDAVIHGAATASVPLKDTVKIASKDRFIKSTLQRDTVYACQTPQVFRKELYRKAVEEALEKGREYTDDCQLLEAIGEKVYLTQGSYENIKITTPEDILIADAILEKRGTL